MDRVASHFGQIDVLINDAGIVPHFQWGLPRWPRIRDMDQEFWHRILDTNLGGAYLCTKHVLPYMEARRSGHIVNLHGGGGGPGACVYVVSKDAIRTFTKFVAEEEREHNVCVVVLSPGAAIATEDAPEEARQRMPGPEFAGERFVLAAQAPMELSGQLLTVQDGRLVIDETG
jgi:NAD(P)-dependent dehydrogenase (short-subunit alcohol dehydrogenase family)